MIHLNWEARQSKENKTATQELGRGRPVLNSATMDLLNPLQQFRAGSEQQITTLIEISRREPNGALRERDRLLIEQETQNLHNLEEGVRKFLEGVHK